MSGRLLRLAPSLMYPLPARCHLLKTIAVEATLTVWRVQVAERCAACQGCKRLSGALAAGLTARARHEESHPA